MSLCENGNFMNLALNFSALNHQEHDWDGVPDLEATSGVKSTDWP